jgi:hypothetical protein
VEKISQVFRRFTRFQFNPLRIFLGAEPRQLALGKLPDHPLTLGNWVLAEKDLVATMEAEREGFAV